MKFVILAALAAVALAAPKPDYGSFSAESAEFIPILKDERVQEDDGRYNLDIETGNGIFLSQSGSPDGPDGAVVKSGVYSYTAPDGTPVEVKFVADANGYQPQSDLLPVAPAVPPPHPPVGLAPIAVAAAAEDAARDSSEEGYSYA
ncbi:cuticle protein AMP1A-like isoform X22 [Eriocheir sinensis]|uniref:cuticle protein AMP1A-like isoform X19 n=1 Tax=Eriocheir sinensis TaxID=95602 RepID=UPI0021C6F254|nr:cuticle protein AMP1A-like isoform X19 [Eriocheir sinensis]XP_050700817.1 cuticle protein AMP1A-like isoform X20 [Eriocheir sinensis]XP_050700818.1 cuticle protein AMP1A-like isoform X21 [Eriocheir sinensis]XP_050700819.1 cuticle protein AMP1A-like isoform X22 [Eriocheir sinensis]